MNGAEGLMKKQLLTYEDVKEKAFRLLEYRAHSEKELSDKLRRHGAAEEHIYDTLELCRRYGFVNDRSYAERKARDLSNLKRFGIRRIRMELKQRGIADEYIEEALEGLDKEDMENRLSGLVEKKLSGDFSRKNIDKCIRYFAYRGYDIYDIKNCISEIAQSESGEYYD